MNNHRQVIKTMSHGAKNIYKRLRKISTQRQIMICIAVVTGTTLGIVFNQFVICLSISLAIAIALISTNENNNI